MNFVSIIKLAKWKRIQSMGIVYNDPLAFLKIIAVEHVQEELLMIAHSKRLHIYQSITLHLYICEMSCWHICYQYLLPLHCDTNRHVSVNDILDIDYTMMEGSGSTNTERKTSKNEL